MRSVDMNGASRARLIARLRRSLHDERQLLSLARNDMQFDIIEQLCKSIESKQEMLQVLSQT